MSLEAPEVLPRNEFPFLTPYVDHECNTAQTRECYTTHASEIVLALAESIHCKAVATFRPSKNRLLNHCHCEPSSPLRRLQA